MNFGGMWPELRRQQSKLVAGIQPRQIQLGRINPHCKCLLDLEAFNEALETATHEVTPDFDKNIPIFEN